MLVVSDHGFHSWRKAVNLNTWLVQQGYMVLQSQGQAPGEKKLDDLFGGGEFWENVDWSRTRAYAMGLGQIYFNLRGREARGIVSPGAEAKQLADELSARLLTMTDPDDGARIVRSVYQRDAVYTGEFLHNASELQVGMEDGYRVSWQTTLGGSPPGIVYPNMKKWSGDHGGYDFATTAGVLVSNKPFASADAVDRRHCTDGAEVLRPPDSGQRRWQIDLLRASRAARPVGPQALWRARRRDVEPRPRRAGRAGAPPQTPAERASERIRALQREAEALVAQESQLLVELRKLELERQIKVEELAALDKQQQDTSRQLNDAAARADALRKIADADRPDIEARLVHLYQLGRAGYWRLLLDVDDLRSLGRVYRTAAAMTHLDRERIQSHKRTLDALADGAHGRCRRDRSSSRPSRNRRRRRARRSIARCRAARRSSPPSTSGAISMRSGRASSKPRSSACRHR